MYEKNSKKKCHSERSEESVCAFQILRLAQNDTMGRMEQNFYFCSTFKLAILLLKSPAFSSGKTKVRTLRIRVFPSLSIQCS